MAAAVGKSGFCSQGWSALPAGKPLTCSLMSCDIGFAGWNAEGEISPITHDCFVTLECFLAPSLSDQHSYQVTGE